MRWKNGLTADTVKEILNIAQPYRASRTVSNEDNKRHDQVKIHEANDMLKMQTRYGFALDIIAEIFKRDLRTVTVAIEKAKNRDLERQGSEPIWVAKFVRELRDRVHVPGPASLLVKDPSKGRVRTYDEDSCETGHFYWGNMNDKLAIWLYVKPKDEDEDEDEPRYPKFLEYHKYYEEFLNEIRPWIKPLVNEYKKRGIKYVSSAKKLRDLLETMIVKQLSKRGYEERGLEIAKDKWDQGYRTFWRGREVMKINNRLFDDAYTWAIHKFEIKGKTDEEIEKIHKPEYMIIEDGDGVWQLRYGLALRAKGPDENVLEELEKIHRAVVDDCLRQHAVEVRDVFKAHKKALEISEGLHLKL